MSTSSVRAGWAVLVVMTLGAVQPVAGQVSMRLHAGAALPAAGFGDFYEPGVALRFDVAYPIRDRLDLVADLGMDYVNGRTGTYVPDTHLWSFQVGLETDLLAAGTVQLRPYLSAGAVSFRTKEFQLEDQPPPPDRSTMSYFDRKHYPGYLEQVSQMYVTAKGGLRLGIDDGQGVIWWLSGEYSWTPVAESEVETIRAIPLGSELSPFGSATNLIVTLGISVRR